MRNIIIILAFLVSACVSEQTSVQIVHPASKSQGETILVGAQVPAIEKLVIEAKYARVDSEVTSKWWPKPEQVRIDDLEIITLPYDGLTPAHVAKVLRTAGYELATSHEGVIFSTKYPTAQLEKPYHVIRYDIVEGKGGSYGRFLKYGASVKAQRVLSFHAYVSHHFPIGTNFLVHKPAVK